MRQLIYINLLIALLACSSWATVKEQHPRLYLTDARMAIMKAAAKANTPQWQRLKAFVDGTHYSIDNEHIMNRALVYKIKKSNGDADANIYKDAAIARAFSLIEYGAATNITPNGLVDSTKNWIDEGSMWNWDVLGNKSYYGINPDITQNKLFRMNVGYGRDTNYSGYCVDSTCAGYTDTMFYIHPDPATSLVATMFSPRSEFSGVANTGDTFVIFPVNPDYIKDRVMGVALVFDWLYEDLTTPQKDIMVAWLYATAKFMMTETNFGTESYSWGNYPLNYLSDLTAIAYAIHGYDTGKANEILAYVDNVYVSKIKDSLTWTLQGGGWLEGDGYGASILHRFTEFLDHGYTAEGIDRWADFSEALKDRLLYSMHMTLPPVKTGTGGVPYREIIANGDGARAWESVYDYLRKSCLMIINHYPDDVISKTAQTFFSGTTDRNIFLFTSGWEFMFYNPNQATLPIANAPLQNAAINVGMVQMRSGWGHDDTQATFKCGPKLSYHSHLDATAFTIFKHQDLAPDTGTYPGSGGSTHGVNYFARTIAHNALLLHDPTENSWTGNVQGDNYSVKSNDGGQRNILTYNPDGSIKKTGSWQTSGYSFGVDKYLGNEDVYKMGSITKYDAGTDFVYSVGEATSGYDGNTHKAGQVLRKFLYLRPDFFVVYDKIKTKNTTITPKFVLHSVDSLTVNGTGSEIATNAEYHYTGGNTLTIDNGTGRLFSKTLLPASPVIKKIGGRGLRDFWVNGANYPSSDPYGLWRAEVEAPIQSTYTEFLTTLYATSTATSFMPASQLFVSADGQMKGVQISTPEGKHVVLFSGTQGDGIPENDISYSTPDGVADVHIILDLKADTLYHVLKEGATVTVSKTTLPNSNQVTSSHGGTLQFGTKKTNSAPIIKTIF